MTITIRLATDQDFDAIWNIFHLVVGTGDTYPCLPETTKEEAQRMLMGPGVKSYVAFAGDEVVGTYFLKPNQPGLGSHVANAGYMVHPNQRRQGVGRTMALHSLAEAKAQGYLSMQFNLVVSTNERAIRLWKEVGFSVIGTVPKAFRHATHGLVDVLIMHRFVGEST